MCVSRLQAMKQLVYVGEAAFSFFPGNITIRGVFPKWKRIMQNAFFHAGTATSVVSLNDAAALEEVQIRAFAAYKGTVAANGSYPRFRGCTAVPGGGMLKPPGAVLLTPALYVGTKPLATENIARGLCWIAPPSPENRGGSNPSVTCRRGSPAALAFC